MMVAAAVPLRNLRTMSTETMFNKSSSTEDIYLFKGSQDFGRSSMFNATDFSDDGLAGELNGSSSNKGAREGTYISGHVQVTRMVTENGSDLNHGGIHDSKHQSSSPVDLDYIGVCPASTLESKSAVTLEPSCMQISDGFKSNILPNNLESDPSSHHISSAAEEAKNFAIHGGIHEIKHESSSPVDLDYSGVCPASTLEGESAVTLEPPCMRISDGLKFNILPNNLEPDLSSNHMLSSTEEEKQFSTCASHMKLSKEEVGGYSSSCLHKDILKDSSRDSRHLEGTALGLPNNTEQVGAPLEPTTLDTLTANLAAKEDTAPNCKGDFEELGKYKSESMEPDSRMGTGPVDLAAADARHINDSRCSLGVLLLSDGEMSHNKPESLPASALHDMVKAAEELHPSSGVAQPEVGGLNHVHDEPYNFPEKWYEHSEDGDFHSSTFSGPIAFSGSITYSGVITYSGPIPRSGSISHRSDSSTSTRSFAFPVLASDWNSSPVKMAQPDARFLRRRRRWNSYFCCKRPSTLFD